MGLHIKVRWNGTDLGAGIADFDVYVSTNGGPWNLWIAATPTNSAGFLGEQGHTYAFYSIARDQVGFVEAPPATVECLELLGVEPWNLRQTLVRTFLERLEATGNAQARELVFHSEPGHVACDLADPRPTPERVAELWPQFQEIAERHLGGQAGEP